MSLADRLYAVSPYPVRVLGLNLYAQYLHWLREGRRLERRVERLEQLDREPPERIRQYQLDRLNEIIAWAAERVPYYESVLGGAPQPFLGRLDDLGRLPKLSKSAVRDGKSRLVATGIKTRHGHTSGTTGTPLSLAYDLEQVVWNRAAEKVVRLRAGLALDDRVAVIWGRQIVPRNRRKPPYWAVNYPDRELWLSAFHISPRTAAHYCEAIREFGARALESYPSAAYVLAHMARSLNLGLKLDRVLTTSETLFPFQRRVIEEAFDAEVFDYYGNAERVAFGVECSRHDGLHLLEGYGYVEGGGAPEPTPSTRIVASGLTNRGMPLLRYELSDLGSVWTEPCPCGLTSRRLSPIVTKREDLIVTPDGRYVSSSILTHPFKPLQGVLRSKIVQERLDEVVVYLEVTPQFDVAQEATLLEELGARLGDGVTIRLSKVDELPVEPSGKFRWVVSKIPGMHQAGQIGDAS